MCAYVSTLFVFDIVLLLDVPHVQALLAMACALWAGFEVMSSMVSKWWTSKISPA